MTYGEIGESNGQATNEVTWPWKSNTWRSICNIL